MEKSKQSGSGKTSGTTDVGGTEGGRRPTGVPPTSEPLAAGSAPGSLAVNGEVREKPLRRRFTVEYKLRILDQADRCQGHGELGALLRREGLYSSHLSTWRKQREQGILQGLTPRRRGRKAKQQDPLAQENQRLLRENQQLLARLKKAETIIDFQKKLSEILGLNDQPPNSESDR